MYSCSKLWYHEYGFGLWVVEADDSFACLTRLSSIGGCGLAETVGLVFVLTPTVLRLSPSWISCVCCWCLLFVLGIHKQHRSWSWIDAMVSSISWWSGFGDRNRFKEIPGMMDGFWTDDFRLAEDWWKFCFWRYSWSIAEISDGDGYGYESTISLWRVKHWRDNFVLRIIQNWIDSILRSSWKWIGSNWTFRDSYFGYVYRDEWMTCRKGVWKFMSLTGCLVGATCHSLSI